MRCYLLVLCLMSCSVGHAQTMATTANSPTISPSSTPPRGWFRTVYRSPAALAILQASLGSLGSNSAVGTSASVIAAAKDTLTTASITWSSSGSSLDVLATDATGQTRHSQFQDGIIVQSSDATISNPTHRLLGYLNPGAPHLILAKILSDSTINVAQRGTISLNGHSCDIVDTFYSFSNYEILNSRLVWYIDAGSHLPVRITYFISTKAISLDPVPAHYDLSDFSTFGSIKSPRQISKYTQGHLDNQYVLTQIKSSDGITYPSPNGAEATQ
jgi:hypothetical protein